MAEVANSTTLDRRRVEEGQRVPLGRRGLFKKISDEGGLVLLT